MILQLLKFEWYYHLKQKSFLVCLISFFAYGVMVTTSGFQYLEGSTMYNDGYNVALVSGLISMFSVLACMIFCVYGVLRDSEYQCEEIIYSTGIDKMTYFLSRYLGVVSAGSIVSLVALLGMMLGALVSPLDPETIQSFEALHYLRSLLLIILPNILISTSLVFITAVLSRKAIMVYLVGLLIIAIHWGVAVYINSPVVGGAILTSPEDLKAGTWIDILGLAAFFEQTQFLTPIEKNSYSIGLSGSFLWNRLLWLTIGGAVITCGYQLFTFRKIRRRPNKKKDVSTQDSQLSRYRAAPVELKGSPMKWLAFSSILRLDVKSALLHIPFLIILVVWLVLLVFSFQNGIRGTQLFGARYPTTDLLVGYIVEVLPVLGLFLILYYSGAIIWSSRIFKMDKMIDATPTHNWTLYSSKLIALLCISFVLIVISITTGVTFQLLNGFNQIDFRQYLSIFYFSGVQLVLYSILAIFIQTQVPHRILGMILTGGIVMVFGPISDSIGIEHPLLKFLHLPSMARAYSSFMGYGHFVGAFNMWALYWSALSIVIMILTSKYWLRGASKSIFKSWGRKWLKLEKSVVVISLSFSAIVGGLLFYELNVKAEYISSNNRLDFNEKYERQYKSYQSLDIPQLVSVSTEIDLYPDQKRYEVSAETIIVNRSGEPITQIFVTAKRPMNQLDIEGGKEVFYDDALNTYLYEFADPIESNEERDMSYAVSVDVGMMEVDHSINENGSYIRSHEFSPYLGYVEELEIASPFERTKRGLPVRVETQINDAHLLMGGRFNFEDVAFETTISTDLDQTALSSGVLVEQWKSEGRNYFNYKSISKINSSVGYMSARYLSKKVRHQGIEIEIYYDHHYPQNVEEILKVTKATIDYCTEHFGPYPHPYLRIAEMSVFGGGGANGQSMPGLISVNEKVFKRNVEDPESFNVVARVVVHEVSHQWWGGLLTPKRIEGAMVLSESFAKYSEMVILEKLYGTHMTRQLSEYSQRRYFGGRSYTSLPEPPLYLSERQQYLGYHKGAIVLGAIRKLIGEESLNRAMAYLVTQYSRGAEATTLDLLDALYEVSESQHHVLIDDWLKRVITYDLSIASASAQELPDGAYEISIKVKAERYETNEVGLQEPIGLDESLEVGLFSEDPLPKVPAASHISLEERRVNNDGAVLIFRAERLPKFVMLDPFFTRLDRNMSDNKMLIEVE